MYTKTLTYHNELSLNVYASFENYPKMEAEPPHGSFCQ